MEQWHIHVLSLATEQQRQQLVDRLQILGCSYDTTATLHHETPQNVSPDQLSLLQLDSETGSAPEIIQQLIDKDKIFDLLVCPAPLLQEYPRLQDKALEIYCQSLDDTEFDLRLAHAARLYQTTDSSVNDFITDELLQLNLIGQSPAFRQAMQRLLKIAETDAMVLISGETGTGKELAAKAIHYSGTRADYPFQAINCGSLPEHLIENELFGHSKGAYTDARNAQAGLIKLAEGGTLFLDEIDALTLKSQTALLRFLQEHEYRPLGSGQTLRSNVRIVAASNADLAVLVEQGRFRQDLFYRINLLNLALPPLRLRDNDILLLADHFLLCCQAEFQGISKRLHTGCRQQLLSYTWPGNVRELQNFIYKSYLLSEGPLIFADPDEASHIYAPTPTDDKPHHSYNEAKRHAMDEFERRYLIDLLSRSKGNVTHAAELAGKERRALGKLLKKHDIQRHDFLPTA